MEARGPRFAVAAAVVVVVVGAGLAAASCGQGGSPPARGFDSVQLVPIRDSTLEPLGQWSPSMFAYSVQAADGTAYFFVDLTTGQTTSLGHMLPPFGTDTSGDSPYDCQIEVASTGRVSERITDKRTGQVTVLYDTASVWPTSCPLPDDPELLVWSHTADGHLALVRGPFDHLVAVPLDVVVDQVITFDKDAQAFTVLAEQPAAPGATGIFRVDLTTGAGTPLVAPSLGDAAWAAGAPAPSGPGGGALGSGSLATSRPVEPVRDHFIYPRTMSDGSVVMFAGPFAGSPSEVALFPADDTLREILAPSSYPTGLAAAWASSTAGGQASQDEDVVRAWLPEQRRLVTCPLPPGDFLTVRLQPSPETVLISTPGSTGGSLFTGPLLALSAADPSCTVLAGADVADVGSSPDRHAIYWLIYPPTGDRELWTAASDGSGARKLGAGAIDWATFASNSRIELALGGDLVWLDIGDDPPRLHYIAEGVFGQAASPISAGSWIIAGYDYSVQDSTGTLGIVQSSTGDKLPISRSVSWYWLLYPPPPSTSDSLTPLPERILYLVHGRNPSSQDGMWMATVTADELN